MKSTLVDTDILSLFLRGEPTVVSRFGDYLKVYKRINLCIITYYEIVSGLKFRDAKKQLDRFMELVRHNTLLPLTERSSEISAEIYANLRKQGRPIDDSDLLIAGIALENNLVIATRNLQHFDRIEGLTVVDWSQD